MGPSPVKSSTVEYGFTTISLGQMLLAIETTKTRHSWNTTNINKEYENISGCDNSNEILKSYLISEKYLICKKESNHHRGTTIR